MFIDIHTHHLETLQDVTALQSFRYGIEQILWSRYCCAAIHPWDVQTADLEGYEKIVPKLFAISEIGLDKFHPDFLKQTDIFKKQLLLAERYEKVVVVHSVKSHNETTNILSHHKGKKIIHSFIGNLSIANRYIKIGCRLSFSPQSLSSPKTVDALQGCSLNDIFIETDTSNMPIEEIYTKIASYKSCLVEDLKEAITNNFKNTFYEL